MLTKTCDAALAPVDGGRECCHCPGKLCPAACVKALWSNAQCVGIAQCPEVCPEAAPGARGDYAFTHIQPVTGV